MKTCLSPFRIAVLLILAHVCVLPGPLAAFGFDTLPAENNGTHQEAAPVTLRFSGNASITDSDLRAAAAAELSGIGRSGHLASLVDDAAFQMERAYHRAGYHFAVVDYHISEEPLGIAVEFSVSEGPRVVVAAVTFEGNAAFSHDQLLRLYEGEKTGFLAPGKLFFVETEIGEAINRLRDLYYTEGYIEARVEEPLYDFSSDRQQVTVHINLHEGERILIKAVEFHGEVLPEAQEQLQAIAGEVTDQPFFRRRRISIKSKVQEVYANLGYPASQVEVDEERQNGGMTLRANITSGPQISIREIVIHGNQRTRAAFILSRLSLRPGDLFSLAKKRESFRKLYQTGLFSHIAIDLDEEEKTAQRDLLVRLEENPAREIFFQGGWGSYELLRGSVGFLDRNLMGSGRSLRFEGGGSVRSLHTQATVSEPMLFNSDISADLPLYFRQRTEPSFTREETGGSLLLSRKIAQHGEFTLGYLYKSSNILEIVASPDTENVESNYTVASAKAQATWDNRNDLFFPTEGRRFYASAEAAEPGIGSQLTFWRFNAGLRAFVPLAENLTLAFRYDTGLILPGGDQVIVPLGERFFNGGENTVRSLRESELGPKDLSGDPIGGNGFNTCGLELRRRFGDHFAASLFFDYGNIAPNRSREEQDKPPYTDQAEVKSDTFHDFFRDFRPAVGAGFQYLLPIGPARLDFAMNPDRQEERSEDRYTIHFSIGMAF